MKTMSKRMACLLLLVVSGALTACHLDAATGERMGKSCMRCVQAESEIASRFWKHRSPLVKYPARTGAIAGGALGVPLIFPHLALGLLIPAYKHGVLEVSGCGLAGAIEFIIEPVGALGSAGAIGVGAPCWLIFGWWWPPSESPEDML